MDQRSSVVCLCKTANHVLCFRSCCGRYLTASNEPVRLGVTGKKVTRSLPARLDSSLEWEPVRDGGQVKLMTRYGNFLRSNGGVPVLPWRNSVTHDVSHRTVSQCWVFWGVDVVKALPFSPHPAGHRRQGGQIVDVRCHAKILRL
ncbi:uncharacterized protein LOC122039041 [Zingiber officinale]|uniref:uncharacterized protein LOC122039041 n=1 Tax=Zingiber officinale TaxID=94328 RepID=UPI001C4C9005|nr:uncharacterized protein LOC122039041 [Zingiber officinale]